MSMLVMKHLFHIVAQPQRAHAMPRCVAHSIPCPMNLATRLRRAEVVGVAAAVEGEERERVVVVGAHERLVEVEHFSMRAQDAIELLRLRMAVAASDGALAAAQNLERKSDAAALVVVELQRE